MDNTKEIYVMHYEVVASPTKRDLKENGFEVSRFLGKKHGFEKGAKGFFMGNKDGDGIYYPTLEEITEELVRFQQDIWADYSIRIIPHHPSREYANIGSLLSGHKRDLHMTTQYEPLSQEEHAYLQQRLG